MFYKYRYFGGGTVAAVVANRDYVQFKPPDDATPVNNIHGIFEDGTLNYQGIIGECVDRRI